MLIAESEVLERIGTAIDDMDLDELAKLHNDITIFGQISGDEIISEEGWHLIPKEGAH